LFELRYDIPIQLQALTQTQLYGFFDHGWLHNLAPVPGTFTSVDAASFGGGLRLGWLNAVTADLSVKQVAQGQGLVGPTAISSALSGGPRRIAPFFSLLRAGLSRDGAMHPRSRSLLLAPAALRALGAAPAAGGPAGGTVVGGTATIQGQGGPAVIVNQSSNS